MEVNLENVGGAVPVVPVPLAEAEAQLGAVPIADDVAPEPAQQPDMEVDEPNEPNDAIVVSDSSQSQSVHENEESNQNVPEGETTPKRNKRKW